MVRIKKVRKTVFMIVDLNSHFNKMMIKMHRLVYLNGVLQQSTMLALYASLLSITNDVVLLAGKVRAKWIFNVMPKLIRRHTRTIICDRENIYIIKLANIDVLICTICVMCNITLWLVRWLGYNYSSQQLSIKPSICAPGTHYCWVARDNVDSNLAQGFNTWPVCGESNPRPLALRSNTLPPGHALYNFPSD
jgi:hypothetical protein